MLYYVLRYIHFIFIVLKMTHFETSFFFFFFLTWGSCSSPSGSLKSSSAPNFKMADNSSLLKGVELKLEKTKIT